MTALPKGYTFPNDTPGPVANGCGREGCGHAREDHHSTVRTNIVYGLPYTEIRGEVGRGPCNVRGEYTHCICYEYTGSRP